MLKRVVNKDNFNSDYPDEYFLNCGPLPRYIAEIVCVALNYNWDDHSTRYWEVVDIDYKLQPGFEP